METQDDTLDPLFFDPHVHLGLTQDTRYGPLPLIENPKKLTIIVGVPRSGTSLCTLIFNAAGFNVFGDKWPKSAREGLPDNIPETTRRCLQYEMDKHMPPEVREHVDQKTKDMNRSGFWEDGRFSVRGLTYNMATRKLIHDIQSSERPPVGKIVCQGLPQTDPNLIGQIVYTIRNPHKVAKSQERLRRGPDVMGPDGMPMDITEELKIHTPEMYIRVTYQACKWLLAHPHIPIHFYNYDDLIDDPEPILQGIQDFMAEHIGEDMAKHEIDLVKAGLEVIEPSSRRSDIEDVPSPLWEEAEFIYEKFCKGAEGDRSAFVEIVEYMERIDEREIHKQARQWPCWRLGGEAVNEDKCAACRSEDGNWVKNRIIQSKYSFTDWRKEPCMAECGMSKNISKEEYITIEESIENNFWVDIAENQLDTPPDKLMNKFIHKPFMKKLSPEGTPLIQQFSDETTEEIIRYITEGVPPGMLAAHFEATEENLMNYLRHKFGRFQLSAILNRMRNNDNHDIYNFEYQVGKFMSEKNLNEEQLSELKGFLKSLISDVEKKEVDNALIKSK
jgi:hypothetical protein